MVELKNIAVSYGEFEAIANLNLKIVKGEFFTFLGSSGCGKTTTLRTIAGFLIPTSRGNVFINNRDVTRLRPGRAQGWNRVPELCALPTHDGPAEHWFGSEGRVRQLAEGGPDCRVVKVHYHKVQSNLR